MECIMSASCVLVLALLRAAHAAHAWAQVKQRVLLMHLLEKAAAHARLAIHSYVSRGLRGCV